MATPTRTTIATNRRARRDFEIVDTLECGMVLKGSEVKSLRESKVQLGDSFGRFRNHELYIVNLHVAQYSHGSGVMGHDSDRERKLLAHRRELTRWESRSDQDRLVLVPLSMYFLDGRAKVEMALAKGRRSFDKRQVISQRDADREAQRAMSAARRRRG